MVWIGNFSYTIFLFHSFGTSGGRILLKKIGVDNTFLIFLFSLTLGLLLPVVIEKLFDKYNITRLLFLGRPIKSKSHSEKLSNKNSKKT